MTLRAPRPIIWDNRLTEADRAAVATLNASLDKLNGLRAVEIAVSGKFARSKIAWKLAAYQHVLLHRIVALIDSAAVSFNNRCTLSAMLSARAFMETMAVMAELESQVALLLEQQDLRGLDAVAQKGIFASRDDEWLKQFPETKAVNILSYIDKFDKRAKGFREHYDPLSERCHPNSLGHNFMFASLNREDGSITFHDERDRRATQRSSSRHFVRYPLSRMS